MRIQNDQNGNSSDVIEQPTQQQLTFLNTILFTGIDDLGTSLRLIHDIALYESETILHPKEKKALYHLKCLWENLAMLKI